MASTVTAKMEASEPPIRSSVNKHQFGEVHFSDTDVYLKGLLPPDHTAGQKDSSVDPIKTIEHFRIRPRWLFVRVETEKGIVGWGEATLEVGCSLTLVRAEADAFSLSNQGHSEAVEGAFVDFRERFIGWDASNVSL